MFDVTVNPPECVRGRARREVQLMDLLNERSMTITELTARMDVSRSAVKDIVRDLCDAGVIHRQLGTHQIFLASGDYFDEEPDSSLSWMQT